MKFKALLAIACIAAAAASCSKTSGTTKIAGTAPEGFDEVNIVIEKYGIDTLVAVTGGKFACEVPTDPTEVGVIAAGYYQAIFIPDGTSLSVNLDGDATVKSSSKKSPQAKLAELERKSENFSNDFMTEFTAISEKEDISEEEMQTLAQELYESTLSNLVSYLEEAVYDNRDNAVSAIALSSLGDLLEDDEQLEYLIGTLSEEMQANTIVSVMQETLDYQNETAEGCMFKDFSGETPDGEAISLSDYVGKGNYVLVDFWASWCGPCKEEIPNIRAVYNKYNKKGLTVLSVAVWDDPEDTAAAAKQHGVTWNQMVNAGSIPTDIYGITGIPHIILFGPDGTILKRGLRGDAIEAAVAQYIQ